MTTEHMVNALVVAIFVGFIVLARWSVVRTPNWGEVPDITLARDADGDASVPVTVLMLRRTLGSTTNGMSPQLWVTPTGLRFKIFKPAERRFSDFQLVEAHGTMLHATRLIFVGHGERLHAVIPDRRAARAVLRLLPRELPLSPAAAALRDGQPARR